MIEYLILSVLAAYGMAVVLVEKKRQWPIRRKVLWLQRKLLPKIHRKLPKMLDCTVCTSFWTALISDIMIALTTASYSSQAPWIAIHYWAFPLSGFLTLGLTWTVLQVLSAMDNIGNKKEDYPQDMGTNIVEEKNHDYYTFHLSESSEKGEQRSDVNASSTAKKAED